MNTYVILDSTSAYGREPIELCLVEASDRMAARDRWFELKGGQVKKYTEIYALPLTTYSRIYQQELLERLEQI